MTVRKPPRRPNDSDKAHEPTALFTGWCHTCSKRVAWRETECDLWDMSYATLGLTLAHRVRPLRSDWIDDPFDSLPELEFGPRAVLVRPVGPAIDASAASNIAGAVSEALADRRGRAKRLLVDLSRIENPSSICVGLLLELARIANEHAVEPVLQANSELLEILRMLQLDGRYTMVRSKKHLEGLLR